MTLGKDRLIVAGSVAILLLFAALVASLYQLRSLYAATKLLAAEPLHIGYFDNSAESAAAKAAGKDIVVLFGDSRIAGWRPLPQLDGMHFANRGIGGETTSQMKFRFGSDVISLAPKAIIVEAGINDLLAAALSPQEGERIRATMLANLEAMTEEARAAGMGVVLLPIIVPNRPRLVRLLIWPSRLPELVTASNRDLAAIAARLGAVFPDANELFLDAGAPVPSMFVDELHFSRTAYERLNGLVHAALPEAMQD